MLEDASTKTNHACCRPINSMMNSPSLRGDPEYPGIRQQSSDQSSACTASLGCRDCKLSVNKVINDSRNLYQNNLNDKHNSSSNGKRHPVWDELDGASHCGSVTGHTHSHGHGRTDTLSGNDAVSATSRRPSVHIDEPHRDFITLTDNSVPQYNGATTQDQDNGHFLQHVVLEHQEELVQELDAHSILQALTQAQLLSSQDELNVNSKRTRRLKVEAIISIILGKGPRACQGLKDIIKVCNPHLYRDLVKWEKNISSVKLTKTHAKAIELMHGLLVEEMDVSEVIMQLQKNGVISNQDVLKLKVVRRRKDKAAQLMSLIIQKGEVAYSNFKQALEPSLLKSLDAWEHIAQGTLTGEDHHAREAAHRQLIRKKWKTLVEELQLDMDTFSRLYQSRVISEEEERDMAHSQEAGTHATNRRLLLRLDSKDQDAFQDFIHAIKESQGPLGNQLERWLNHYKDQDKQSESGCGRKMSKGQKAALLLSYWELRDHVDVKDWADELIQEGVLQPQSREVLDRTFSREARAAYVLYMLSQQTSERAFNVMVSLLDRDWPNIGQLVKDAANQEQRRMQLYLMYCDTLGVMELHIKEVYVHPASGSPVIETIHFHDYMRKTIVGLLSPFAEVIEMREGSIVVVLNFRSLVELTQFWLACLDGSLQAKLGDAVATECMRACHSADAIYSAAIDMTLDRYISIAYQLTTKTACQDTPLPGFDRCRIQSDTGASCSTSTLPRNLSLTACSQGDPFSPNKGYPLRTQPPSFASMVGCVPEEVLRMMEEFQLPHQMYQNVSQLLDLEMDRGLARSHQHNYVKMLPTCVHVLPDGTPAVEDKMLALHFGGSHLRVHLISMKNDGADIKGRDFTIGPDIKTGPGMQLFDFMAECVATFMQAQQVEQHVIPLRFILSYPFRQAHLANGHLVRWTKGVQCGHEGEDFVQLLQEAIDRRDDIRRVRCDAIMNDTVSTLMATAALDQDCAVAVIIGTGTNACYVEKLEAVEKWQGDSSEELTQVVVNTEWGAFGEDGCLDGVRTEVDRALDQQSTNKGQQIYEKMISGMYIAEITRLVLMKCIEKRIIFRDVPAGNLEVLTTKDALHAEHMSQIEIDTADGRFSNVQAVLNDLGILGYTDQDCASLWYISSLVSTRAAYLAASGVATIINRMNKDCMTVAVEGSLYRYHPHFHHMLEEKVKELIKPSLKFKLLVPSENESQCGPALLKVDRYRMVPTETVFTGAHGRAVSW